MGLADEMRDGQRDGPGHAVHGQCAGNGRELIAIEREVIALECDRRILRSVEEVGAEQMRVEFVDASGDRSHVNTDVDTAALLGPIKRRGATCGIEMAVKRREAEVAESEARGRLVRIERAEEHTSELQALMRTPYT